MPLTYTSIIPLDSQSSRQCVYSGLWHNYVCLLGTFSSVESLMATPTGQCQFQSWASKERNRKIGLELGRKAEKLPLNFFHIMLSGVILFS